MTSENLFNIWQRMCRAHWFDEQLYEAIESKQVKCFCYLSSGQESIPAAVAEAFRGFDKPAIFCQHRGHASYISFGGDLNRLKNSLLRGHGGDPMIDDPRIKFFGHSGLVADQVPIAVGYAFATREPVVCFLGDATVEEDVFWPSVGFAATHNLPVLFICEDNGLSVITRTEKRRSWNPVDVAAGYGIDADEIVDDPTDIYNHVEAFLNNPTCPLLLSVQCVRKYRHVGIGQDSEMTWDRMNIVRGQVGLLDEWTMIHIESNAKIEMEALWQ